MVSPALLQTSGDWLEYVDQRLMVLFSLTGVTMTVTASKFVRQGKADAHTLTRAWIVLQLADG